MKLGYRLLCEECSSDLASASDNTIVDTAFCTPYDSNPSFSNDAEILKPKVGLEPNQITN